MRPFQQFTHSSSFSGVLLLLFAAAALVWANSPLRDAYFRIWETKFVLGPSTAPIELSIGDWINEALMSVFFLFVGLEIKRELLVGEISSWRLAALPVVAAAGGMVVPAAIYLILTAGTPGSDGWGIPMATDIAFALAILRLMGPRCPVGLKIFLTAVAIVDDLGGVVIIALFYTRQIDSSMLLIAGGLSVCLILLNMARVRFLVAYIALGHALWVAVHGSGVHATLTGVIVALAIPARTRINATEFSAQARNLIEEFDRTETGDLLVITSKGQQEAIHALESASEGVQPPMLRLEHALQGVVGFGIVPLFALANAGVTLGEVPAPWESSVVLAVLLGLVVGKPAGIMLFSWLAIRLRAADLPRGTGWRSLFGAACLGGVGFTMSLFIAGLAFGGSHTLEEAKIGILLGSTLAAIFGCVVLLAGRANGESSTGADAPANSAARRLADSEAADQRPPITRA